MSPWSGERTFSTRTGSVRTRDKSSAGARCGRWSGVRRCSRRGAPGQNRRAVCLEELSRVVRLEPALFGRFSCQLGSITGTDLLQDASDMELDGVLAEVHLVGDLRVGQAFDDERQDLVLHPAEIRMGRSLL